MVLIAEMRCLISFLVGFFLVGLTGQQRAIRTVGSLGELASLDAVTFNGEVMVLGAKQAGDGWTGLYYYDRNSTIPENPGTAVKPTFGSGRWILLSTEGNASASAFGAVGDGVTDDTLALQAAIDYAELQVPTIGVHLPAANYLFRSLLIQSASIKGISQANLHTLGSPLMGARLTQMIGATNHGLVLRPRHLTGLELSNFDLVGNREDNQKNPFTITSASTRTNFVVNPASGTWPTAPATPTIWPYYGYCFFFTSEKKYAGAGLVVNRNTGTGAIDLMPYTDTYATVTNNSYLLSAGWTVCFAENTTETAGYKTTTGIDSSMAGYNGIHLESDSVNKLVTKLRFNNLRLWHWHTAIRMGNTLANTLQDIWIGTASFAGIAGAFPGDNRDDILNNIFIQGYWLRSNNTVPETLILENQSFRKTLWGYYGLTSSGNMEVTTLDNTVNGLFVKDCLETKVGALHIDGPMQVGIWFGGGLTDVDRSQTTFGSVVMRNINLASDLLVGPAALNPYYAINVFGTANSASINQLDVTKFGANNRYYNAAFHAPVANGIHVNNLYTVAGATNMFSSGTTHFPSIGNYRESPSVMRPIVGGVSPMRLEAAQFTASVPMVTSNTFTARSTATFNGTDTYVTGNLRIGANVSTNKLRVFASGFNATDSMGMFHNWGADSSTGDSRTDLANKEWRIYSYGFTNANPKFTTIWAQGQSAENRIWLGGGDSSSEVATEFRVYTAPRGALGGTNQFEINSAGEVQIAHKFRLGPGGPTISFGSSVPGVAEPNGSTYHRSSGGPPWFYVREGGAWVAK